MARFKSDFLNVVQARGFIHQCTDEDALDAALAGGVVTAYTGYDCTATSLHVGSLIQIMFQRWFQKCGHRPIVLMGGGTTKVGDPTGRDDSRPVLTNDIIAENMAGIRKVFDRLLSFGAGPTDALMVNNDDWLSKLNYIEFLRDIGPHFTINRMLTMDSVKLRLEREHAMTFLEFNYMILQGYDYLELARAHNCRLQMSGSDQWGNIVQGIELNRRIDGREVFGLTTPLLATASGAKMGKSQGGAVWLNEDLLSAYDFWQYWRNTEDADVGRFLKLFTELPLDEIARLEALDGAEINDAKKILATEVTSLVHGADKAAAAAETARETFEQGLSAEGLPSVDIASADLEAGIAAFQLLRQAGLCASGGEARRLIKGGGARLNDVQITDENQKIGTGDLADDGTLKLSSGKKRHVLVKAV